MCQQRVSSTMNLFAKHNNHKGICATICTTFLHKCSQFAVGTFRCNFCHLIRLNNVHGHCSNIV
uniref:Uncharacterized protein n=1 Tax=Arundo donax TaxID=35708 RepID=A0A0A9GK98_ARUDO